VLPVKTDVTSEGDCQKLIDTTINTFQGIDVLVLNAGISGGNTPFSTWKNFEFPRQVMETNYWGTILPFFFALPHLRKAASERKSRASVVIVSSLAGQTGTPLRTAYAPTKFALHGFEQAIRFEEREIDFTAVCPGYVLTEIHDTQLAKSGLKRNLSKFMSAEEAARQIVDASFNCDRLLLMTVSANLLYYLRPFVPNFILDPIITNTSNSAFVEGEGKKNQ